MSNGQFSAGDGRANLIRAFKATGCVDCKARYPDIDWGELHIHHRDPTEKELSLGRARGSSESILRELVKCEVLCLPCHRNRHASNIPPQGQLPLFNGTGHAWR